MNTTQQQGSPEPGAPGVPHAHAGLIGAVIAAALFAGDTQHAVDFVASALYTLGQNVFSAAFLARLPVNIADKTIAVFIAYGALQLARQRAH